MPHYMGTGWRFLTEWAFNSITSGERAKSLRRRKNMDMILAKVIRITTQMVLVPKDNPFMAKAA